MNDGLLPIDKVAKQSGIASSALRYYERRGLIAEGVKIGGRRHYQPSVLHRLSVIKVCRMIGFSLSEIARLLDDVPGQDGSWREVALQRRAAVQEQIGQLHNLLEMLDTALDCSCPTFCDCPRFGPDGELTRQSSERVPS
jgi:MerR family redox-sensitive transcriptional activator SoxR